MSQSSVRLPRVEVARKQRHARAFVVRTQQTGSHDPTIVTLQPRFLTLLLACVRVWACALPSPQSPSPREFGPKTAAASLARPGLNDQRQAARTEPRPPGRRPPSRPLARTEPRPPQRPMAPASPQAGLACVRRGRAALPSPQSPSPRFYQRSRTGQTAASSARISAARGSAGARLWAIRRARSEAVTCGTLATSAERRSFEPPVPRATERTKTRRGGGPPARTTHSPAGPVRTSVAPVRMSAESPRQDRAICLRRVRSARVAFHRAQILTLLFGGRASEILDAAILKREIDQSEYQHHQRGARTRQAPDQRRRGDRQRGEFQADPTVATPASQRGLPRRSSPRPPPSGANSKSPALPCWRFPSPRRKTKAAPDRAQAGRAATAPPPATDAPRGLRPCLPTG